MLTIRKEQLDALAYTNEQVEQPTMVSSKLMLTIRKEQIDVFRKTALYRFEDEMLLHLSEFSPPLFKTIGSEQMRKVVQFGIAQAGNYGFTFRGSVRFYLELMLLLGSYFDTDPQYPWAAKILAHQELDSQMQRAEQLYEKAMDYQHNVLGSDDVYRIDTLRNTVFLFQQPLTVSTNNFLQDMLCVIDSLYPQKAIYVGREGFELLIRKAMAGAQRQHFTTVREAVLVSMLMLTFGHGCAIDPLYPWIFQTLKDETQPDSETKAKQLEQKTLTWIEQVLVHYDKKERQI